MKPLYSESQFEAAVGNQLLPVECESCKQPFYVLKRRIKSFCAGRANTALRFCGHACASQGSRQRVMLICTQCSVSFERVHSVAVRTRTPFCSIKCAVIFNHKKRSEFTKLVVKMCCKCFKEPIRSPGSIWCSACTKIRPTTEILCDNSLTSSSTVKYRVLKERLLLYKCAICGLDPLWNQKQLTLQLDHIDGKRNNHTLTNLRFLCPNCHSQTSTWKKQA